MHSPLLLTALLGISAPAHAWEHTYTADGHKVRWTRSEVTVGVGSLASVALRDATRHAVDEWALATQGHLTVRLARAAEPDILILVVPDSDWRTSDENIALASVQHDGSGRVQRAWIELRASHALDDETPFDLRAVLTHELGHALGLAHEHNEPEATMAPTLPPGPSDRRYLHDDDIEGIQELYPASDGRAHLATCSNVPTGSTSVLALAALFGLRRTRRRHDSRSPTTLNTGRSS